ncbi:hypothetical protein GF357_01110 [Candidatus Dojkabacteria bacterium]|nr:hypothetical protein [Candidatus Dojkabacteria bacterium]
MGSTREVCGNKCGTIELSGEEKEGLRASQEAFKPVYARFMTEEDPSS